MQIYGYRILQVYLEWESSLQLCGVDGSPSDMDEGQMLQLQRQMSLECITQVRSKHSAIECNNSSSSRRRNEIRYGDCHCPSVCLYK